MLYVYHGTDTPKSLEKAHNLINSLRMKRPDATYVPIIADNWTQSIIEEHLGGQGLFSNKYIVLLDRVTENIEAKDIVAGLIPALKESTNIFIILEGKLNVEWKKAVEKNADKVVATDVPVSKTPFKDEGFNIFLLADAVGSRRRSDSWKIYRMAVDKGVESESILGTLFWQVKSMVVANGSKNAGESGLSPFVYSKSKKYAGNYSDVELAELMTKLVTTYHDGHRGLTDLELATEKLLLSL